MKKQHAIEKQEKIHLEEQNEGVSAQNNNITLERRLVRSAPLPDPDEMRGYKSIDKTFPSRIMAMAEREQKFRHIATYLGQIGFWVLAAFGIGSSIYLALLGKTVVAVALVGMVTYIVYVSKSSDPKPPQSNGSDDQ